MGDKTAIEWADPLTLAYLAGVVDSDGYISISRSERKGRLYHGAVVGISGTRPEPHRLAASIWGGRVARYDPKNPRHRAQFQWSRMGESAVAVLEALRPHLRVKAENADLAIMLQEHVRFGAAPDPFPWYGPGFDPVPEREAMRAEMIAVLNQGRHNGFPAGFGKGERAAA